MENTQEQINYQKAVSTYLMSQISGDANRLLSIDSAPGMGKIAMLNQALLDVNEKNGTHLFIQTYFSSNVDEMLLLLSKNQNPANQITLIESVEHLDKSQRKELVSLAQEKNLAIIFSATTGIDDTYAVSTDMEKFISQGVEPTLKVHQAMNEEEKKLFNIVEDARMNALLQKDINPVVVEDLVINEKLLNVTFDKNKVDALRNSLNNDLKNTSNQKLKS